MTLDVIIQIDPGEVEGTNLRVLKYPHPALRAENEEIVEFTDDVKKLARDMFKVRVNVQKFVSARSLLQPRSVCRINFRNFQQNARRTIEPLTVAVSACG